MAETLSLDDINKLVPLTQQQVQQQQQVDGQQKNFQTPAFVPDTFGTDLPGQKPTVSPQQSAADAQAPATGGPVTLLPPPDHPPDAAVTFSADTPVEHQVPSGKNALPQIAHGVAVIESGNRQVDDKGKPLTSPKGAIGKMGLMPDTAKSLGVDPNDETQNVEGGTRLLGQLYDKYKSWPDALAAYNWGPGNFDKWMAAGRKGKVPAETESYVQKVMAQAGLAGPGVDLLSVKRRLSLDDIDEIAGKDTPVSPLATADLSEPNDTSFRTSLGTALETGADPSGFYAPDFGEQSGALLQGVRKGVTDLVAGPAQLAMEASDATGMTTGAAGVLTQRINDLEEQYGGADLMRKHPVVSIAGQTIGITAALLASRGALGAIPTAAAITRAIPPLASRVLGSFALGATAYNPGEHGFLDRAVEGAATLIGGELGNSVAKSAKWAVTKLADKTAYNTLLKSMEDAVGGLTRNAKQPLDNFLGYVKSVWQTNNSRYGARNVAGQGFEGLDSDTLRAAVGDYANESKAAGVAVTPGAKVGANRVYEALGLRDEDARKAAHDLAVKEYEAAQKEWSSHVPKFSKNEEYQAAITQRYIDSGRLPPPPTAPAPYAPVPVTAVQHSAALTAVNRSLRSVPKADNATRHQLMSIKDGLYAAAKDEAAAQGLPVEGYLRKLDAANRFYEQNIAPIKDMFGTSNVAELARTTPAKFYDTVYKVIEGGDLAKIEVLKRAVGQRGLADLQRITLHRMLDAGTTVDKPFDSKGPTTYVRNHWEAMQALYGRQGVEEMLGWAKIADRVSQKPTVVHSLLAHAGGSGLPAAFALWQFARAGINLVSGGPVAHHIAEGAGLLAVPFVTHGLFNVMEKASRVPAIMPLVRAAARAKPDSPQMDALLRTIQRRYLSYGQGLGRSAAQGWAGMGYQGQQPEMQPLQ